jgi:hypothetical protein
MMIVGALYLMIAGGYFLSGDTKDGIVVNLIAALTWPAAVGNLISKLDDII